MPPNESPAAQDRLVIEVGETYRICFHCEARLDHRFWLDLHCPICKAPLQSRAMYSEWLDRKALPWWRRWLHV
jgi:uncharacterized paraquat-inducible protein A